MLHMQNMSTKKNYLKCHAMTHTIRSFENCKKEKLKQTGKECVKYKTKGAWTIEIKAHPTEEGSNNDKNIRETRHSSKSKY